MKVRRFKVPAKANHTSRMVETYSQTLCARVQAAKQLNEMDENDTTKMNVKWNSGTQVKRATEKTSMRETD